MLGKKIRLLRKEAGLTQLELANRLNVAFSTISMYERGEREPNIEMMEALADEFNVDMNFLLDFNNDNSGVSFIESDIIFDDYFPLHYNASISAGSPQEYFEDDYFDSVVYVPIRYQRLKNKLIAMKVNGDSMNNVIPDNSVVVIEKRGDSEYEYKNGDIVVAFINGDATVKRFYFNENGLSLLPDSKDKSFQPIFFNADDNVQILGKVIYFVNPDNIMEIL